MHALVACVSLLGGSPTCPVLRKLDEHRELTPDQYGLPLGMRPFLLLALVACAEPEPETTDVVITRDTRYCEVIPVFLEEGSAYGDVWNTVGFNDCPQDAWDALDSQSIRMDLDAAVVVMNGPRSFLMDHAASDDAADAPTTTFGSLQMALLARIEIDLSDGQSPYSERAVARETVFSFRKGSEVYELLASDGGAYVMQSYAMIVDPDLTVDDLPHLGDRLELPEGWTYRARVLEEQLDVDTAGRGAVVVQDELQNTYQQYAWPK